MHTGASIHTSPDTSAIADPHAHTNTVTNPDTHAL